MAGEPPTGGRLSEIEAEFHQWRQAHPNATLTELEVELDRRLRAGRARLLGDVAGSPNRGASVCPDYGAALVANGHYPARHFAKLHRPSFAAHHVTSVTTSDDATRHLDSVSHAPHGPRTREDAPVMSRGISVSTHRCLTCPGAR